VEANHQYSSGTPFDPSVQAFNVLKRMAQNLGHALPNGGWVGNDDLVFYVDTQDGNIILNCNNEVIGGGNGANSTNCPGATPIDFKGIAFRGTFVLQGNLQTNGPASGPAITMQPPSPAVNWCPGPTPDNPVINGFLYIGGDVTKWNGTPPIYGSIDVEGDTAGSGNGKLYFRSDFNYDLVGTGGISVEKWQEIKPSAFPTPLP
jgi:hypothetical protein